MKIGRYEVVIENETVLIYDDTYKYVQLDADEVIKLMKFLVDSGYYQNMLKRRET